MFFSTTLNEKRRPKHCQEYRRTERFPKLRLDEVCGLRSDASGKPLFERFGSKCRGFGELYRLLVNWIGSRRDASVQRVMDDAAGFRMFDFNFKRPGICSWLFGESRRG